MVDCDRTVFVDAVGDVLLQDPVDVWLCNGLTSVF